MKLKTKSDYQTINFKDTRKSLSHFKKEQMIFKVTTERKKSEDNSSPSNYAINNITENSGRTLAEQNYKTKQLINRSIDSYKSKRAAASSSELAHKADETLKNAKAAQSYMSKAKSYVTKKLYTSKIQTKANKILSNPFVKGAGSFINKSFTALRAAVSGLSNLLTIGSAGIVLIVFTLIISSFSVFASNKSYEVSSDVLVSIQEHYEPDFTNVEAWITLNPYAMNGYYGQCTWFAWGRFYEIYGYSPGFTGDGWNCVDQLVAAHPDTFVKSMMPSPGAIFSGIGRNHVAIVLEVYYKGVKVGINSDTSTSDNADSNVTNSYDNNVRTTGAIGAIPSNANPEDVTLVIQSGNLDGKTNTFVDAQKDWQTVTYTLKQLQDIYV